MPAAVAIVVRHPLPRYDGRQPLGIPRSHSPLRPSVVANTKKANLTCGPLLHRSPFDNVEERVAGPLAHCIQQSRALPDASLICPNNNVPIASPPCWIQRLQAE